MTSGRTLRVLPGPGNKGQQKVVLADDDGIVQVYRKVLVEEGIVQVYRGVPADKDR